MPTKERLEYEPMPWKEALKLCKQAMNEGFYEQIVDDEDFHPDRYGMFVHECPKNENQLLIAM